jgi:hypothetical protein
MYYQKIEWPKGNGTRLRLRLRRGKEGVLLTVTMHPERSGK